MSDTETDFRPFAPQVTPQDREEWLRRFVAVAASAKGLVEPATLSELQLTAAASFGTVYKAVVLDIDGTLAPAGSYDLEPEALAMIAELLRKGIPVAAITGRGRTSAIELAEALRNRADIADGHLRRLYLVTHNGAFMAQGFGLAPITKADFVPLVQDDYPDWRTALLKAMEADDILSGVLAGVSVEPYSLRVPVRSEDVGTVRGALEAAVESVGANWIIHQGTYGPQTVLEVTGLSKRQSLEFFSDAVGVRVDQILRVGDQGQEGGNDYELLSGSGGFSVGLMSKSPRGCIPVLNADGTLATGPAGVRRILRLVPILPSISILVSATDSESFDLLHRFERLARVRARSEWRQLMAQVERCASRMLRKPLSTDLDAEIEGMFDRRSGAVLFRDYEMSEVSTPFLPLGRVFDLDEAISPEWRAPRKRAVFSDTGVLLRGWTYYYFQDVLSKQSGSPFDWETYSSELVQLLRESVLALESLPRPSSTSDFKLLVGLVDNVRNCVLHCVHAAFRMHCATGVGHLSDAPDSLAKSWDLLEEQTRYAIELLLDPFTHFNSWVTDYRDFLIRLAAHLERPDFPTPADELRNDQVFRWREADWMIESVAAVQLGVEEFMEMNPPTTLGLVGLAYGGLELPAIASVLAARFGLKTVPALVDVSIYRASSDAAADAALRNKGADYLSILQVGTHVVRLRSGLEFDEAILLDDNCTTGRSLEAARDSLAIERINTVGVVVLRFPGVNRWRHMTLPNHGMVDPRLYFGFVRGLVSGSPYTRLLRPGSDPENPYLDELGFFDKARLRIDRLLFKTHADELPSSAYGPPIPGAAHENKAD